MNLLYQIGFGTINNRPDDVTASNATDLKGSVINVINAIIAVLGLVAVVVIIHKSDLPYLCIMNII